MLFFLNESFYNLLTLAAMVSRGALITVKSSSTVINVPKER